MLQVQTTGAAPAPAQESPAGHGTHAPVASDAPLAGGQKDPAAQSHCSAHVAVMPVAFAYVPGAHTPVHAACSFSQAVPVAE